MQTFWELLAIVLIGAAIVAFAVWLEHLIREGEEEDIVDRGYVGEKGDDDGKGGGADV